MRQRNETLKSVKKGAPKGAPLPEARQAEPRAGRARWWTEELHEGSEQDMLSYLDNPHRPSPTKPPAGLSEVAYNSWGRAIDSEFKYGPEAQMSKQV